MSKPQFITPGEERHLRNGSSRGGTQQDTARWSAAHGLLGNEPGEMQRTQGPIERLSFAELAAANPTMHPSVIDGLLRQQEILNIISYSKVGKSWLGYSLLLSIIIGRTWLGRFPTTSGKCLLIGNELHKPTLVHRIRSVAAALEIPCEQFDMDLEIWPLRGSHRSFGEIALERVEPGEFKFILFDAKYRFTTPGVSENDNAAETLNYNLLDEIAEQSQAAIGLIHHASKGGQADKRTTDVGAGAGAQSRAADTHLILREHEDEGVVVLEAALRSFAPVKPLGLRWEFPLWEPDLCVDTGKLKGKLTQGEQRTQDRDKEGIDKLVVALRKEGDATPRELRRRTGISKDRADRLLDKLQAEGHVTSEPTNIRGNETRIFRLTNSEE